MSVLDDFVPENDLNRAVFLSVAEYGITFSKSSVEALGYPRFVKVLYDRKGKRVAIQPTENKEGARLFVRKQDSDRASFVRWIDKKLLSQILALGGLELHGKTLRVFGEYIQEENVLIYSLKNVSEGCIRRKAK